MRFARQWRGQRAAWPQRWLVVRGADALGAEAIAEHGEVVMPLGFRSLTYGVLLGELYRRSQSEEWSPGSAISLSL